MKPLNIILSLLLLIFVFSIGFLTALFITFSNNAQVVSVRLCGKFPTNAIKIDEDIYFFDKIRQTAFIEQIETATRNINVKKLDNKTLKKSLESLKERPPRIIIGNMIICCDKDNLNYSIMRNDFPYLLPLLEWTEGNNDVAINFSSVVEKEWILSRFSGKFSYSKEGYYKGSCLLFAEPPGKNCKLYRDSTGNGIYDIMYQAHDNVVTRYRINGTIFEKISNDDFLNSHQEKSLDNNWQQFINDFGEYLNSHNKSSDNSDIPAIENPKIKNNDTVNNTN
jgi:hypothetical protein